MLQVFPERKPNPLQDANLCSRLVFWWINPLFKIGHKRRLEKDDMYSVLPEDRCQHLGEKLQGYWDQEVKRAEKDAREPSLMKAIIKCYWKSYLPFAIFKLFEETFRVLLPTYFEDLITYFQNYDPSDSGAVFKAYGYTAVLNVCLVIWAILQHFFSYYAQRIGMRLRVAMCHMIYRKTLRLSNSAIGKTTTGQIVNLLSNDVNRFDRVIVRLHILWIGPLNAITVIILLWMEIGISSLAGMALLIIFMLLQSFSGKLFSSLRSKTAALTDTRLRTMNEVITGIRTIKMYAWEKSFAELITRLRRKEISKILRRSYLDGMNLIFFDTASRVILFVTFTTYVLLGNMITVNQVFLAITLYQVVQFTGILLFPTAIENVASTVASVRRIKNFLLLDELPQCDHQLPSDGKRVVNVQDFTGFWDKELRTPTLQGLSFTVRPGELLAVVGPVGAGKSSLLSAVLGELPPSQGQVSVHGRIAYVSQQPWVFSATVRSNILFGKKYEEERYEKVIKACALEEDLQFLENGDLTVVGDRGTTLSGGQKARVSLARALYQDADIYLLDDPLSTMDAEVSRHLFEQCICQVLHEKITILVTHQWQYLKDASQILLLEKGEMVQKGTYAELLKSGVDFASLLKEENEEAEPSPVPESPTMRTQTSSESSVQSQQSSTPLLKDAAAEDQDTENIQDTLSEERRLEGKVGFKTYKNYFRAGAHWSVIIFLVLVSIAAQVAYILEDWWLLNWANEQDTLNTMAYEKENITERVDLDWYLGIFSGLTASSLLFGVTRSLLALYILVNSSQTLHNKMLKTILRVPVLFFDRNPAGRILNRFSKDIGYMDDVLPSSFQKFMQTLLQVIGVVVVVVMVIPWIAIPVIPLGILFFFLRRYFLETSRDVKRLECSTQSSVFSHLASSLQGLWTIRAYKAEQRFQELFDLYQDLHSEAWFLLFTITRWFSLRLDIIYFIFICLVDFGALLLAQILNVGQVGLILSYALNIIVVFPWCIRLSVEVEHMMISVERVIEYIELEQEAPWELEFRPPPDWPNNGMIALSDVNFKYSSDGPLVLKDLTTDIKPGEKVGIVGRTGAGKSSFVAALFRLSEPEGRICIDKILTTEIGLHDLRKKMSIIPQDPIVFTGTMRKNLDPFNKYTDEELWNVLEEVQLKEIIKELPDKMDTELVESGSNLSVGQKQLVCLARAILRKNQILIIDEATAHVDPSTDELIQKKIREKFAQCTVLTIAHRLSTIIDSDRIMVLDSGRLEEYDEPYVLLQNRDSLFYKMVQQLGKAKAAALTETAKQVYLKRNYPDDDDAQ
ncbi:multidrug resistance-associated protein 4-like isoform X1 [Bos indicus x Bos taurus]|uniref:Multidrug resistance-associated protein 4 n=1 Tax=Bos indicus x Bos taurus TaxID=30522 RepID=A0A4W2IR96_BOBOX|nr:multidrug resistance-associated protein 4-like isoform X1 [Bos indicus x Bos taurus]XP_027413620.1 multidrug resistance-associated protein 4-like isoform X1 [Bos indicus x Bos taurus]